MSNTTRRAAVAAVLCALSLPAFAGGEGFAAKQDCSVCDDPTWPELRDPMPAVTLGADRGAARTAVQIDPTWPELQSPMPAIALRMEAAAEPADVQSDPTWPAMPSVAPALAVNPHGSDDRVARR
jgi:hypothetical protein